MQPVREGNERTKALVIYESGLKIDEDGFT
jgi:hypothetical protein